MEYISNLNLVKHSLELKGVIGMKYDIIEQIGKGSFGEVYLGKNKRSGEHVAIKCENKESKSKMLKNETRIYRELKGGKGIANVRWYGVHENQTYAVLDLLGKSLDDYKAMHETFTLKTILLSSDKFVDFSVTTGERILSYK